MIESEYLEENDKLLQSLKRIPSLEQFKENELRILLHKSKIRKYRKGERIIKEGATGAWIYILVYGRVEIIKDGRIIKTTDRRGELDLEQGHDALVHVELRGPLVVSTTGVSATYARPAVFACTWRKSLISDMGRS